MFPLIVTLKPGTYNTLGTPVSILELAGEHGGESPLKAVISGVLSPVMPAESWMRNIIWIMTVNFQCRSIYFGAVMFMMTSVIWLALTFVYLIFFRNES